MAEMKKLPVLLSDSIAAYLNKSIGVEMNSSHIYLGIASWMADNSFNAGSALYEKYSSEELKHAAKLREYIDDRNCQIVIPLVNKPDIEFAGIIEILQLTFDHEVKVENNYKLLSTMALREGDHTTYALSQWFLNEQIEEVAKVRKLCDYATLLGDKNPLLNYMMEKEFEELIG